MTRNIIIGIGVFSLFLLNSCGQPSFNRNSTIITFIEGKPYSIPRGAYYTKSFYGIPKSHYSTYANKSNSPLLDENTRQIYLNSASVACNNGEVRWFEKKTRDHILPMLKNGVKLPKALQPAALEEIFKYDYDAYMRGKIGCAKPLNQQEYEYRLNQQNGELNRRAAAKRTSSQNLANTAAAMAPKTVNVNHSGSVDVYRY